MVPQLVSGPFRASPGDLLEHAITATSRRGYHPESIDRTDGTFIVTGRSDPRQPVTFEIQCTRDGWIVITPRGDRVVDRPDGFLLRGRYRDEYQALAAALSREVGAMDRRSAGGESPGAGGVAE